MYEIGSKCSFSISNAGEGALAVDSWGAWAGKEEGENAKVEEEEVEEEEEEEEEVTEVEIVENEGAFTEKVDEDGEACEVVLPSIECTL